MQVWQRTALITVPILVLAVVAILVLARDEPTATTPAAPVAATEEPGAPPEAMPPLAEPYTDPAYSTDMERDREIFEERMAWARAERLDTLPVGEIIARLGRTFVGEPYTPNSLDVPGPERLVINLREHDCVTYVENLLAMARMIRAGRSDFETFQGELARIRYRDGTLDGYPSRLHYFSDWIADNERLGLLVDITQELGGQVETERIDFMTSNPEAYRQLADVGNYEAMRQVEQTISGRTRYVIPQRRIADVAPQIRDGDIIAATSSIQGLDIAHTGIALWVDGRLHLMHAPLVGRDVEISELPLADRIQRIQGQDGIMVARPTG